MSLQHVENVGGVTIHYADVLKALNLDPSRADVQALVLACNQYGLDPVLGHMVLIDRKPYITHKGLLHVAHVSGQLDGIVLEDEGENQQEWYAKVSVWRKDMQRPFTYRGRYSKAATNKKYGAEMAVARAETMALRRAFDVSAPVQEEQDWEPTTQPATAEPVEASTVTPTDDPADPADIADLTQAIGVLTDDQKQRLKLEFAGRGIPSLKGPHFAANHVDLVWAAIDDVNPPTVETVPGPDRPAQADTRDATSSSPAPDTPVDPDKARRAIMAEAKKHDGLTDARRHLLMAEVTGGQVRSVSDPMTRAQLSRIVTAFQEYSDGRYRFVADGDGERVELAAKVAS